MIIVNINPEETYARVAGLWQYDYGQVLRIQGLSLPPAIEIHFSLQETGGEAITRIGVTKDGVTDVVIPDSILDGAGAIEDYFAYAFIYPSDDNSGQTEHRIEIGVKSRPKPEGYKGSGDDTMGAIMNAVNEIAAGKADGMEYKNSILRLMSGDKELARVTISGGSGGGADAREIELQKSETAIQWRYVGEEDWNDLVDLADLKGDPGPQGPQGEQGPAGKDGADGAPGKDGADGVTPHIGDNGNWYIGETDTGVKAEAPIDSTLTESGMAADAAVTGEKISELNSDLNTLRDQIGQGGSGSGVSSAMASSLWEMLKKCAYISDDVSAEVNAFKSAWGIEESGSDEPTTAPTLTSITVTWSSDSADVGTDPKTLISVVKANYSDGTSRTVTGYTVTPSALAKGANTVTVSYSGKTSTKTITGNAIVAPDEPTVSDNLIVLSECGSGTLKDGSSANGVDMLVTPYIKVDPTKLYYTNINKTLNDGTNTWNQKLELYTADQARIRTVQLNYNNDYGVITEIQDIKNNSAEYVRILFSVKNDNPYFGESGVV